MEELVETVDLCKNFHDFWGRVKAKALDRLNLKVYRGEIFGLLGPNGSGKTTTIKLLLGLLFPTSGRIRVLRGSPRNVENKKQIGFLPEETYLYPYQNAEEALFFYGRLFGLPRNLCQKRVNDLLEMVGLLKARKRPLKEYSKGMARRIGIAQALINDPELVFLDEPTSGLDPIGTREIKDLILQLKKHGKTVFLCSHLLADVEDICDRIAILYGGKIRCEGAVRELLTVQSAVQMSFENLQEDVFKEILKWLEYKKIPVSIDRRRERLESFFLKIIEQARNERTSTSGAEAGKTMDGFFSTTAAPPDLAINKENQVIAELLAGEKKIEKPIVETKPEEAVPEKSSIIQNLLSTKEPLQSLTMSESPSEKNNNTPPQSAQKWEVLEKLLSNHTKEQQ